MYPLLLAVQSFTRPHLAVIQRSGFCDEGSLFVAASCPGFIEERSFASLSMTAKDGFTVGPDGFGEADRLAVALANGWRSEDRRYEGVGCEGKVKIETR